MEGGRTPGSCRDGGRAGEWADAGSPRLTQGLWLSLSGRLLCSDRVTLSPCSRLCRRVRPRCHRDSEHSDLRWGRVSGPLCPHIHGLPPALHLPDTGDHQLQSGYVCCPWGAPGRGAATGGDGPAGPLGSDAAQSAQSFGHSTKTQAEQLCGAEGPR